MPNPPPQIAQLIVAGILTTGSAVAWIWIASRLTRGQRLLPREWERPVPWDGIDLLLIAAGFIVAQVGCVSLGFRWAGIELPIDHEHPPPNLQIVLLASDLAARAITLILAASILQFRARATLRDMGFDFRPLPRDFIVGLIAFLAAVPVVFGVQIILVEVLKIKYDHPLIDAIQQRPDTLMIFIGTVSAVVVAPIVEEFLFRVVLQGWLEKWELRVLQEARGEVEPLSDLPLQDETAPGTSASSDSPIAPQGLYGLPLGTIPILVSSTLFALVHLGQGAAPIPLFVLALVLGFLYQRTHRIVPSLTVHMLLNGVSMVLFFAASGG